MGCAATCGMSKHDSSKAQLSGNRMSSFSVAEPAVAEIRAIFSRSKCLDPVVRLYERADAGSSFDPLKQALLQGDKTDAELESIGKQLFDQSESELVSTLEVGVAERGQYSPDDLFAVGELTFAIGARTREMLRGCSLSFEDGHFVLRDAANVVHTFRSLAKASEGYNEDKGGP